jgi:hypothetical protein
MAKEKTDRRVVRALQAVVRMHREVAAGALNEKLGGLVARATDACLGGLLVFAASATAVLDTIDWQEQRRRWERLKACLAGAEAGRKGATL